MLYEIGEYLVVGAAGGLLARAVFWHVPLMAGRLARYCHECACWFGDHELYCSQYDRPEVLVPPAPKWDPEAYEAQLFKETGVWWLDPNRWGDQPAQPKISSADKRRWDRYRGALNASLNDAYLVRGLSMNSATRRSAMERQYRDQLDYETNDPDAVEFRRKHREN